eukprot:COSAG01_NODE_3237_length_6370_cov_4.236007_3_plen_120_part_00
MWSIHIVHVDGTGTETAAHCRSHVYHLVPQDRPACPPAMQAQHTHAASGASGTIRGGAMFCGWERGAGAGRRAARGCYSTGQVSDTVRTTGTVQPVSQDWLASDTLRVDVYEYSLVLEM